MNHECIKDLSMKISIEFKDQASRFLSKEYSESKILIQGRGAGLLLKFKRIFSLYLHLVIVATIVGIESVQYLPYQSMWLL